MKVIEAERTQKVQRTTNNSVLLEHKVHVRGATRDEGSYIGRNQDLIS